MLAGNMTTVTVPGLANGVRYYFAVTAIDTQALESAFSNETSFLPGAHTTGIRTSADRRAGFDDTRTDRANV